jgi:hypothetical protein
VRVRIGAAEGGHSTVRVESGGLTLYEGVFATREEAEIAACDAADKYRLLGPRQLAALAAGEEPKAKRKAASKKKGG